MDNVRFRGKREDHAVSDASPDNGDAPEDHRDDLVMQDSGVGWEQDIPALVDVEPDPPSPPPIAPEPVLQDIAVPRPEHTPTSASPSVSPIASPIASPVTVPVRQSERHRQPPDFYRS